MAWKGKGVVTNRNGFGVKLDSKNSKTQLNKIRMKVCANKVALP
jgi:hypothetical protein